MVLWGGAGARRGARCSLSNPRRSSQPVSLSRPWLSGHGPHPPAGPWFAFPQLAQDGREGGLRWPRPRRPETLHGCSFPFPATRDQRRGDWAWAGEGGSNALCWAAFPTCFLTGKRPPPTITPSATSLNSCEGGGGGRIDSIPKALGKPRQGSGSCQPNHSASEPAEGPGKSSTNMVDSG